MPGLREHLRNGISYLEEADIQDRGEINTSDILGSQLPREKQKSNVYEK